ncbi:uncharacterized protein LOC127732831 [Mytilus californianus]|uniref:uncharacterized protein LOC127732831 n=1 Tax=Mytilus californianus TaxID=6549 RepID=UPI002247596C|nr:uncharacterized protein LOC127732831 [Mytilus californianus]
MDESDSDRNDNLLELDGGISDPNSFQHDIFENRFAKCDFCIKIKIKLENQNLSKAKRLKYMQKREKHLKLQNQERQKYYRHAEKSRRYPHKYLCMIIDGMDQNKTNIPHFHRLAKSTSQMWNLRTHLTGVIIHGISTFGFFDIGQWPHDSNLTMNIILNSLWQVKDKLPNILYIQMDNCFRENKNKWVFALCCFLVEMKVFEKVKVNFLMVGHTHEDIDQLFSRFSNWLSRHSAITMMKLMFGFEKYDEVLEENWYVDEMLQAISERPSFNFRPDNLATEDDDDLSDIADDFAEIPPVHLGKPPSRKKKNEQVVSAVPEVGDICGMDVEKYSDFWPQIGEIKSIDGNCVQLVWFKGARTTVWRPWLIQMGKQRKPWTEELQLEDIVVNKIKLTNSGKLSQESVRVLDEIERRF